MMWRSAKKLLWITVFVIPVAAGAVTYTVVPFESLSGWSEDDHTASLQAFRRGCTEMRPTSDIPLRDWDQVCVLARAGAGPARAFFEQNFTPVLITNGSRALFTGYFEPVLHGSRHKTDAHPYPLYQRPPELEDGMTWKTRAEIENGLLAGRGLELVWLDNRVDAFFVHVQGSARIELDDGSSMRVGFAGRNGHQYSSVGRELVQRRILLPGQASIQGIRSWAAANPQAAEDALQHNASFIFFQELDIPDNLGPIGALQVPLVPMRSIAVDDTYTPLGAPVWVRMVAGSESLNRLMVAQDTGSAVNGAQRADIFYGSGTAAGDRAGNILYSGEMITLLPNATAARLGSQ